MRRFNFAVFMVAVFVGSTAFAADWPQWRGPDRNGIARDCPPLLDAFPKEGPKKLWESADVIAGGLGSCAVAGGKVYVKQHQAKPVNYRLITKFQLLRMGYCPDMPPELSQKVEDARVSDERKKAGANWSAICWADQWIAANLAPDQMKYESAARYRLWWGDEALPLPALDKLLPILDKKFTTEEWKTWVAGSGLDATTQNLLLALERNEEVEENLFCLDAANGKTLWKSPLSPEDFTHYPSSATPTITDGKVYISTVSNTVLCLDANTGQRLWESEHFSKADNRMGRHSSILVLQNVAVIVTSKCVAGVSATDGKTLWTVPGTSIYAAGSAAAWSSGGKSYVLAEFLGSLKMIEPQTGKVAASVKKNGAGNGTPVVLGDFVAASEINAYKLSPDKLEPLWNTSFRDDYSSPLVDGKYVYAAGAGNHYTDRDNRDGKAACLDMQTGKVLWSEVLPLAEYGSPILADGKIIAVTGKELVMFKASPEQFQLIGQADLALEKYTSPSIADGKVYLRTAKHVVCYDLAKP